MSRADEVIGLLRGLRDQFGLLDELIGGFRDRRGRDRRRRWEEQRQAAFAAVNRARRTRVRLAGQATVLATGGVYFFTEGPGWAWLAVPVLMFPAYRSATLMRAVAVPPEPANGDHGPVVLPDAPRGSRTVDLLRRAAAARDALDGMLPMLASMGGGLAEVVVETCGAAERAVADLGRGVLGLEQLTRAPEVGQASLPRLAGELERAVVAFEDLAATTARSLTASGSIMHLAEFEARLAGVRAVLRTLQPPAVQF